MITNIENEVYNSIFNACSPSCKVVKGYPRTTSEFPCITFEEKINTSHDQSADSAGEFANDITYEINIFSNSRTPISECTPLRVLVDGVMSGTYRMRRTFSDVVPNYQDKNIYRYLIRYQCVVDKNNKIYRR